MAKLISYTINTMGINKKAQIIILEAITIDILLDINC